jgi:hypothetical protein
LTAAVLTARGAEVDQLHFAAVADHHVLRAQIAMHDFQRAALGIGALVNMAQGFAEAHGQRERFGPRDAHSELSGAGAHVAQVAAFDVLDDDVRFTRGVRRRFENLRHTWMLELRLNPSLVQKTRHERAIVDVILADALDDQRTLCALDAARARKINLAHASAGHSTEQREALESAWQGIRQRLGRSRCVTIVLQFQRVAGELEGLHAGRVTNVGHCGQQIGKLVPPRVLGMAPTGDGLSGAVEGLDCRRPPSCRAPPLPIALLAREPPRSWRSRCGSAHAGWPWPRQLW